MFKILPILLRTTVWAATSLMLLTTLTVSSVWIRSYWVDESIASWPALKPMHWEGWSLSCAGGAIGVKTYEVDLTEEAFLIPDGGMPPEAYRHNQSVHDTFSPKPEPGDWPNVAGLGWGSTFQSTTEGSITESHIAIPLWMITGLLTLPTIVMTRHLIRSRRNRKRTESGHCRKCNYDLRGSPARCPECGTAVELLTATKVIAKEGVDA